MRENPNLFQHKKKNLFYTDSIYCADEQGRSYDVGLCKELWEKYLEWNIEAKSFWQNRVKSSFSNYTDFFVDKLETDMNQLNDSVETRRIKMAILNRFLKQETAESGCSSMDLCSLNEYGSYLKPFGPDYEFPGGYSKLIDYLAAKMPSDVIKLNQAVRRISLADENELILVECTNGLTYRAKHVIVTSSVNYLKANYKSLFDARLLNDQRKIEAINAAKMDTVDKIFLFYEDLSFFPNVDALHPIFLNEKVTVKKADRPSSNNSDDWLYKVLNKPNIIIF